MNLELEREFNDYASCYKYDLLEQRMIDFYMGVISAQHVSHYPEFVQTLIKDKAAEMAEQKIEEIKNSNLTLLPKLAQNAWLDEVEKIN